MGQLFTLAPVPTGMRCTCSDYGATGMAHTRFTALVSPLTYPRQIRSFPVTSDLRATLANWVKGMGRLNHDA
ncbi:Uncharacterised protein [Yersinia enterocolitica]|uniref:Uncharacterized protein n=2 Tax=Yersinia enterocolitica TaxID=630 RepID=A0A0E8JQD5_YEREN|nr:hypothetical protein CH47_2111 [Yersinia enterocolitica]CAL12794.1 hypothetical protein YE2760 [Yersinia enterocolitica subsp. enterocolitica 8081]CCQ41240.1 hypothetical protein YE5303_31922 [Yersinia enterocolitica (type O:5) str. YE53/03]VTP72798.1 Uncharacterised protein [Yersinia enterocolitica subsp. enterocolitica]AJJ22663.1 hypothetical protein CH49_2186 [Yersinia enterocolitica]